MELKDLKNLRPKDRENLEKVVDTLKKQGLNVFLTGSCLDRKDYSDIDLVVSGYLDDASPLNKAKNVLTKEYGAKTIRAESTDELDRLREGWTDWVYTNSLISAHYILELKGTQFHISYSRDPFALNQNSERVKL